MREFLNKVKSCCDVLASVGHKISYEDQILHIISGLGSEYDSIMVSIISRVEPHFVANVHALLLSFKLRLESHSAPVINVDSSQLSLNTFMQNLQRKINQTGFQNVRNKPLQFTG